MSGKHEIRQRVICLLIALLMIGMGMRMEEICVDSLSGSSELGCLSFQRITVETQSVICRGSETLYSVEVLPVLRISTRSGAGVRLGQWAVGVIICIILLSAFFIREKSAFLYRSCENQYRRRTLDYIHHMDGKKA